MEWDETQHFPEELRPKLAELGLMGVIFPEEYGGGGIRDYRYRCVVMEELAAVAAGDGIVLFDTGLHELESLAQLERALDQVNLRLEQVKLVVCTHAHSDHYGQAGPILERAG